MPVHAQYSCSSATQTSWQICGPIESPNSLNVTPSAIQANDGTLWLAWVSQLSSQFEIYYATGTYITTTSTWNWSTPAAVVAKPGSIANPALVQLQNQTIILFYSYKSTSSQHSQLYLTKNFNGAWNHVYVPVPLSTPTSLNDTQPSAAVGRDGSLWLSWTRDNSTKAGTTPIMRQLWYKTLNNGVWATEQPVTLASDTKWNFQPSITIGKDTIVRIVYSRGAQGSGNFQVYYLTYNGSAWSAPVQLTSQTTTVDAYPSVMQDRNGTYRVFWARSLILSGNATAYQMYTRTSTTGGSTWSTETLLQASSGPWYWEPAAIQSTIDKNIWVFFSFVPTSGATTIWALRTTNPITQVHDVLLSFQPISAKSIPCPALPGQLCFYSGGFNNTYMYLNGQYAPFYSPAIVTVKVNLTNLGDFSENFTVNLKAVNTTSTSLGTQRIILGVGLSTVASFNFNTTAFKAAKYTFSGNVTLPTSEFVSQGNQPDLSATRQDPVHLLPLGDIDQDGSDTITDVSVVFFNYGFGCTSQISCSSRYIAAEWGSLDNTGMIDIVDASVAAFDYGSYT